MMVSLQKAQVFVQAIVIAPFLCSKLSLYKKPKIFSYPRHKGINMGSVERHKPPSRSRAEPWCLTKGQATGSTAYPIWALRISYFSLSQSSFVNHWTIYELHSISGIPFIFICVFDSIKEKKFLL